MTLRCPDCGSDGLPPGSRFCSFCGRSLAGAGRASYTPPHLLRDALSSPTSAVGERKEVTVLLADVAESLAMAEALEPEHVHTIMDGFFALALDAVHKQGGTINQFRGDGFMALFGAPRARGEDALRGLHAALGLRKALADYALEVDRRFGTPLLVRMGLNTGTVWVGSIGSDLRADYTAEGATVGLAARLESAAEPGQILVSGATAAHAHPFFRFTSRGEQSFRGLSQPVAVFELIAPGPYEVRIDVERARGLSRFVGRELELARLARLLRPARRLRMLEVAGEAGIGKSRLVLESLERGGVRAVEARARELDASRAYAPWIELLRRWPREREGWQLASALGETLASGRGPRRPGDLACELVALLRQGARTGPCVLLLEDVHWLDPSSRQLLELLAREPAGVDVVVLLTAREDALPRPSPWPRVRLEPLARGQSDALARRILAEVADPGPLVELVVERGGGNPLFVEETARALREGPAGLRSSARLEVLLRGVERVPATLRGVIGARIDNLPQAEKRLLRVASVIGLPFDAEILAALEPEVADSLEETLDILIARDILEPVGPADVDFRHALLRDAAYASLLLSQQRELHRRCALALCARGRVASPEDASRVAEHYARGDQPREAAELFEQAGRAYQRMRAPEEASVHLRRAWELHAGADWSTPAARTRLGLRLATAYNALDDAASAESLLRSLLESLPEGRIPREDERPVARALVEGGWAQFSASNDHAAGSRLIERGLEIASHLDSGGAIEIAGENYLARLNLVCGYPARAIERADRMLRLCRSSQDRPLEVVALAHKALALALSGAIPPALQLAGDARGAVDDVEPSLAAALVATYLAETFLIATHHDEALDAAERALRLGRRVGQRGVVATAHTILADVWLRRGDPARAGEWLDRIEDSAAWAGVRLRRTRIHLEAGRAEDALEAAHEELSRPLTPLQRAISQVQLGLGLGFGAGEWEAGDRAAQEGVELARSLGLKPLLAESLLLRSLLLRRSARSDAADPLGQSALGLWLGCGLRLPAAGLLGQSLREQGVHATLVA